MTTDNLQAAPIVTSVQALAEAWQQQYPAAADDFYPFITTPSPQRDQFLYRCQPAVTFLGEVAVTNYSHN